MAGPYALRGLGWLFYSSTAGNEATLASAGTMSIDDLQLFKREVILALFADNALMQQLVLKGGNLLMLFTESQRVRRVTLISQFVER